MGGGGVRKGEVQEEKEVVEEGEEEKDEMEKGD